jgi:hypothetical protein
MRGARESGGSAAAPALASVTVRTASILRGGILPAEEREQQDLHIA